MTARADYWKLFEETGDIGYYLVYKYYASNAETGATAAAASQTQGQMAAALPSADG
jgi:hypothetical protein